MGAVGIRILEAPSPRGPEVLTRELNQCVTFDEARRLIEAFDAAGIGSKDEEGFGVGRAYETGAYEVDVEPNPMETQSMFLYPAMPDWPCSAG